MAEHPGSESTNPRTAREGSAVEEPVECPPGAAEWGGAVTWRAYEKTIRDLVGRQVTPAEASGLRWAAVAARTHAAYRSEPSVAARHSPR